MFQTVYLCLVTGRMFFYLSSPTSNLNNIFLILFYFHFLKLNWGCTIINNKLIESNDLRVRKRSILRTHAWSAKQHRSKTHLPSLSCALQRLHHLAFIQYWVKSGKDCARAARVRTISGGKTDENIIQINKFCITKVFLPVTSDRHEYFLTITFWNYLKSTGRQATFRPLLTTQYFSFSSLLLVENKSSLSATTKKCRLRWVGSIILHALQSLGRRRRSDTSINLFTLSVLSKWLWLSVIKVCPEFEYSKII